MAAQNDDDQEVKDQQELERVLSLLRPAAGGINRDRFLFLAGQASAEGLRLRAAPGRWIWPAGALMNGLAAVVLFVLLLTRAGSGDNRRQTLEAHENPPPHVPVPKVVVEAAVETPVPISEPSAAATPTAEETARALAPGTHYPYLRSFILAYGIDALPEPAPIQKSDSETTADEEPATVRDLLRQSLMTRSAG